LFEGPVWPMTFTGVGLARHDVHELDSAAVPIVELPHRRNSAARDGSSVGDEVQQYWFASQVA
jgi:hypothetical protein